MRNANVLGPGNQLTLLLKNPDQRRIQGQSRRRGMSFLPCRRK